MNNWNKTSDKWPEPGKDVLGYIEDFGHVICYMAYTGQWFSSYTEDVISPVMCWMEIPPLPREHLGIYRAEIPAEKMADIDEIGYVTVDPEDFPFIEIK